MGRRLKQIRESRGMSPLKAAGEVASRFGEYSEDPLGFAYGPTDSGFRRIELALEHGEPDKAVHIAQEVDPRLNPFPSRRVSYWTRYGGALSQLRGRREAAVRALRTAEDLFPTRVYRDPMRTRDDHHAAGAAPGGARRAEAARVGLARRAALDRITRSDCGQNTR